MAPRRRTLVVPAAGAARKEVALKTDLPLKKLFEHRARDLLHLTGDQGATLRSVGVVELQAVRRTVDCVMELELAGEPYLRHLEFQSRDDPELLVRCLEYDALLIRQACRS